jgi:predicted Zn-dependent protease
MTENNLFDVINTLNQFRIEQIGNKLISNIQKPLFKYTFKIFESEEMNANINILNTINISSPMIFYLGIEENLIAAVLSHEIAHSLQKHLLKQIGINFFSIIFNQIIHDNLDKRRNDSKLIIKSSKIASGLGALKFSRVQELEADIEGCKILSRAGYPQCAMLQLFTKLDSLSNEKPNFFKTIFSTHPPFCDRIKNINNSFNFA